MVTRSALLIAGLAALATQAAAQSGRPLEATDIVGGVVSTDFSGSRPAAGGGREFTQRVVFSAPMRGYPGIVLSVTQLDAQAADGQLAYSATAGQPTCAPLEGVVTCSGFDLLIAVGQSTRVRSITVSWIALNVLTPATTAGSSHLSPAGKE